MNIRIVTLGLFSLLTTAAMAKNYQTTPVWSCDFGTDFSTQVETYLTLDSTATTEQATGTGTGYKAGETFLKLSDTNTGSISGGIVSTFTFPADVSGETEDYLLEVDYAPTYNGLNDKPQTVYGLTVYAADNTTVLFNLYGKQKDGGIDICRGGTTETVLGGIAVSHLNKWNSNGYDITEWLHLKIEGDKANNQVTLSVTTCDDNKEVELSSSVVSSSFVALGKLTVKTACYSGRHQDAGLDDLKLFHAEGAKTFVWTGDVGDNAWATPGNWKVGDVPQTEFSPKEGDTVVMDEDALRAVDQSPKLDEDNKVLGIYPKNVLYWTDAAADDHLWSTAGNWAYGSEVVAYEAPTGGAVRVIFPATFTEGTAVEFNADTKEGTLDLQLDCDVLLATLDGVKNPAKLLDVNSITGNGTLRLGRIWLQGKSYVAVIIDMDVEVVGDAHLRPVGMHKGRITLNGALTGNGVLTLENRNDDTPFYIYGDMSGFAGTLNVANAVNLYTSGKGGEKVLDFSQATVTFSDTTTAFGLSLDSTCSTNTLKVGALTGLLGTIESKVTTSQPVLQVGSLNLATASFGGTLTSANEKGWFIEKIGSGDQVFTTVQGAEGKPVTVSAVKDCGRVLMPVGSVYELAENTTAFTKGETIVFKCPSGLILIFR